MNMRTNMALRANKVQDNAMISKRRLILTLWTRSYAMKLIYISITLSSKSSHKTQSGKSHGPGYAPKDLYGLAQIEGVMTDMLDTFVTGCADTAQREGLASYLVDEEKPRGTTS